MVIVEPFHKHRTKKRKECSITLSHGAVPLLGEDVSPSNDPVSFVRLNLREVVLDDEDEEDMLIGERATIEMTGKEAKDLAERILEMIERGGF